MPRNHKKQKSHKSAGEYLDSAEKRLAKVEAQDKHVRQLRKVESKVRKFLTDLKSANKLPQHPPGLDPEDSSTWILSQQLVVIYLGFRAADFASHAALMKEWKHLNTLLPLLTGTDWTWQKVNMLSGKSTAPGLTVRIETVIDKIATIAKLGESQDDVEMAPASNRKRKREEDSPSSDSGSESDSDDDGYSGQHSVHSKSESSASEDDDDDEELVDDEDSLHSRPASNLMEERHMPATKGSSSSNTKSN